MKFFFYCRNINSKMKVEIHKHFHATATFVQTAALPGRLKQNHYIYIILFTKINKMPYFWKKKFINFFLSNLRRYFPFVDIFIPLSY